MDVRLDSRPALRLATVRHLGPYPLISEACDRLFAIVPPAWWTRPGTMALALYHDDPATVAPEELRSDAAIVVPDGEAIPAGLGETTLPAGRVAVARHQGPYSGLPEAWGWLMNDWWPASGERMGDGPPYEAYLNDPCHVPPDDLLTDLVIPLADRG